MKLDYKKGGLKLTDINYFINSIKGSWIKRLSNVENKGKWKIIYETIIKKYGGNLIFESNLKEEDIKQIIPHNKFFQDVLIGWNNIKCKQNNNLKENLIWNNSNIKIDGKTLFWKEWYEKGISYIEHLYDFRTQTFYKYSDFKYIYNVNSKDYLKYYKLVKIISSSAIKDKINPSTLTAHRQKTLFEYIQTLKKTCKRFYEIQLNNEGEIQSKQELKWQNTFHTNDLPWKKIYVLPFTSTIDTSMRCFQYKFIMHLTATNDYLFKCKLANSSLCDFCNQYSETLEHLFWTCSHVQHLWNRLSNYLYTKNIKIKLDYKMICFGYLDKSKDTDIVNFLILTMKYFIFFMKYRKRIITFTMFKNYLDTRITIEKEIALINNKILEYNKKFQMLQN